MRNQRHHQGGRGGSNDFISHMPCEILVLILSFLPAKDAVVTSSLSKRWRFLWTTLNQLNFDASESFPKIQENSSTYASERSSYITQVNSVIRTYNHPTVHRFRINFHLGHLNQRVIDEWLQFVVNKQVEILELDMQNADKLRGLPGDYDFPLTLPYRTNVNARVVVELACLEKLYLNNVTMRTHVLEELLKRSPHLESLSIHGARCLTHIRVGGPRPNLKHFEIMDSFAYQYVYLNDLDLVSFTYVGMLIELRLTNLPKLKQVSICKELMQPVHSVFSKISFCLSSLQDLSLTIHHPKDAGKLQSIPQLPNVKKLTLTAGALEDDCLLEYATIAESCPKLDTFIIQLLWLNPIKKRRKLKHAATRQPLENLKLFKILGYYGRISDLELAAYVIENAAALKRIVIDPRYQDPGMFSAQAYLLKELAARYSAERELKKIIRIQSPGVGCFTGYLFFWICCVHS